MIAFKYPESIEEWSACHTMLREVIFRLHDIWPTPHMVITRIYSPPIEGESGVHRTTPHRAADIRSNIVREFTGNLLVSKLNALFDYGKGHLQVAIQHGEDDNRHIHLQVRDETHTV